MSNYQNQKNSFISMLEQLSIMNKNSTEILTSLNSVLSAQDSSVTINQTNSDGSTSTFNLPTVANLKSQIDLANANIQKMLGLEGSTYVSNGITSKKVYTLDLSREPFPISDVGGVSKFVADHNWFFESLMNPLLSVEVDLTGKLDSNVNKVRADRYIVKFTKNADGTLDTNGQNSLNDFKTKFIGRIDITQKEFLDWCKNPTNLGVLNGLQPDKTLDEQIFDLNLKTLNFHGTYSVLTMEQDTLNRKLWYQLDTLLYEGIDGSVGNLAVGDVLILKQKTASSKYQIKEISATNKKLTLERIEGYDPVPIGQAVLEYYSPMSANQSIKVSVGFNEYNVLFITPIDTDNNVISSVISKGTAYYSGDLILDGSINNQKLTDFYNINVNDYGAIIKDLGNRIIPTNFAIKPDSPILNASDYQVVKVNRHLTDNASKTRVEQLNTQRKTIKSQISSKQQLIVDQNNLLATNKNLPDNAIANINNTISKARTDINNLSAQLNTVVTQILDSTVDASVTPKFRVRGFFNMPSPKSDQNAIQFEIQYRYSAKDGSTTPTESFTLTTNTGTSTAYYSNWNSILSDIRKRTYNASTETWTWNSEDVSNAEIININQVDIPIHSNEKIDFRIRSISEVGYPESLIFSDWSQTITINFPDSLVNESLSLADQGIIPDTYKDVAVLEVNQSLTTQGYPQHISTSRTVGQTYYSHPDSTILTSFLDPAGNNIVLFDYLKTLTDRISVLEGLVSGAKGELQISLKNSAGETILTNGSLITVVVECESYATAYSATTYRVYQNDVYTIKDYSLLIKNISPANTLGILSDRLYASGDTSNIFYTDPKNQTLIVDEYDRLIKQQNNQFVWFMDSYNGVVSYSGINSIADYSDPLTIQPILNNPDKNVGGINNNSYINVLASGSTPHISWDSPSTMPNAGGLLTTVHPVVTNVKYDGLIPISSDIVESGQDKVKIIQQDDSYIIGINIYFKFCNNGHDWYSVNNDRNDNSVDRYLSVFIETEASNRPFVSTIKFKVRQHKLSVNSSLDKSKFSASTLVTNIVNSQAGQGISSAFKRLGF